MDYTAYTAARNSFTSHPNLCDLFRLLSIETWKRMEFAYLKPRTKIYETTITQNLVFTINAYNDQFGLDIEIFESNNEKVNGNDLELIIRFPGEGVEFYAPLQAKKVYKNGRYVSMEHGVQIESLRNYAMSRRAVPLYLLYNYTQTPAIQGAAFPNPEHVGCTIVSADFLFNNYYNRRTVHKHDGTTVPAWRIPKFSDLHPAPAVPWDHLVCPKTSIDLCRMLGNKSIIQKIPAGSLGTLVRSDDQKPRSLFPIDTFRPDKDWTSVKDVMPKDTEDQIAKSAPQMIDDFESEKAYGDSNGPERVSPEFSPKSRIVLTRYDQGNDTNQ